MMGCLMAPCCACCARCAVPADDKMVTGGYANIVKGMAKGLNIQYGMTVTKVDYSNREPGGRAEGTGGLQRLRSLCPLPRPRPRPKSHPGAQAHNPTQSHSHPL